MTNSHSRIHFKQDYEQGYDYYGQDHDGYSSSSQDHYESDNVAFKLENAVVAAALAVARRRPQSRRPTKEPAPRPLSTDLPVALQSYLSNVFNVDWSVGLASTEDSLFTFKPPPKSSLRLSVSALSSKRKSNGPPSPSSSLSLSSASRTPPTTTSHSLRTPTGNQVGSQYDPYGKSEYDENDGANSPHLASQSLGYRDHASASHHNGHNVDRNYHHRAGSDNGLAQTSIAPTNPNNGYTSDPHQETHVHNHYHIHIHSHASDNVRRSPSTSSKSSERSYPPPVIRSSRYPKPEPRRQDQPPPMTFTNSSHVPRAVDHDKHHPWTTTPTADLRAYSIEQPQPFMVSHPPVAPVAITMPGPPPMSSSLTRSSSLVYPQMSSSLTRSSSLVYPPEKPARFPLRPGEEQPYLATSPQVSSQYMAAPPPPPYTRSAEDASSSEPGSHSPGRLAKKLQMPSFRPPIFTTKPQQSGSSVPPSTSTSEASNQRLIEYQQYQERQKMFVRDDDNKEDRRSTENLGFLRQLFRQNSKKKGITFISAPLPINASPSSSSHL